MSLEAGSNEIYNVQRTLNCLVKYLLSLNVHCWLQWNVNILSMRISSLHTVTIFTGSDSLELAIISTKDVNIRINKYLCTFLAMTASVILLVNVLVIR